MAVQQGTYGMRVRTRAPFAQALERTRSALKDQGFGVITEIDVRATMKEKLGADFRPYVILGACNPTFAHQALQMELSLGLLLPCNVVVYEVEEGGAVVEAVDPGPMLGVTGNPSLQPIATEVRRRLENVLAAVEAA